MDELRITANYFQDFCLSGSRFSPSHDDSSRVDLVPNHTRSKQPARAILTSIESSSPEPPPALSTTPQRPTPRSTRLSKRRRGYSSLPSSNRVRRRRSHLTTSNFPLIPLDSTSNINVGLLPNSPGPVGASTDGWANNPAEEPLRKCLNLYAHDDWAREQLAKTLRHATLRYS